MKERKVFKMENKIDYSKLSEITVKTQEELDLIPLDFKGRIYISGERKIWIVVKNRYNYSVVLIGDTSAELCGNSSAELWENSSAVLYGNSSAELRGNSSAVLRENSSAELRENSSAVLYGNSSAVLYRNSSAELYGNSSAVLRENSSAELRENSSAELYGNSSAVLYGNSSAVLWENSSAVLCGNSSADGYGNSQIVNQMNGKITVFGNARIVYNPKTIQEFMDFFGIKHDNKKAIFYKAVHKDKNGVYFSDYNNNFIYKIGEVVEEECDPDVKEGCSNGIHVSTQNWALDFGKDWGDLAILELETDIDKIVLPKNSDGKVRTSEAKVLREVPLEECGLYGKILAKRRVK